MDMTWEQQRDVLDKSYRLLTEFCGKSPRGNVVPWWECSEEGIELMLKYGIEYDHSMGHHDCQPYYLRKDKDRLFEDGGGVDEALGKGTGKRPGGDSGELVH